MLDKTTSTERADLRFEGLSSGSGPLAWAQHEIWESIAFGLARPAGNRTSRHYVCEFETPGRPDVERVIETVRQLVRQHESLRTAFVQGVDGVPRQAVLESGHIPVFLEDAGAGRDDAVRRVRELLSLPGAGQLPEPATAAGLVVEEGQVSAVLLRVSRLAVDGWGLGLLGQEIRRCAGHDDGASGGVAPSQPLELVRFEASSGGAALTAAALRYWTDALASAPELGWADRIGLRSLDAYAQGVMTSRAVPAAVQVLAGHHRVSSSAVLLGAFSAVLGRLIGRDSYYVRLQASNRLSRAQRVAICRHKQVGLLPVSLPATTFGELMRATLRRSLSAYRHSRYDPVALRGPMTLLKDGPFFNFNDRRYAPDRQGADGGGKQPRLETLMRATTRQVVTVPNHAPNPRIDMTIETADNGHALRVAAQANFLSAERVGTLLTAFESLLAQAADSADDIRWSPVLDRYVG